MGRRRVPGRYEGVTAAMVYITAFGEVPSDADSTHGHLTWETGKIAGRCKLHARICHGRRLENGPITRFALPDASRFTRGSRSSRAGCPHAPLLIGLPGRASHALDWHIHWLPRCRRVVRFHVEAFQVCCLLGRTLSAGFPASSTRNRGPDI